MRRELVRAVKYAKVGAKSDIRKIVKLIREIKRLAGIGKHNA